MGLFDIFKPLSTVPSSAINKSQQHREKILGMSRIEHGASGREASMLPLSYAAPVVHIFEEYSIAQWLYNIGFAHLSHVVILTL